MNTCLSGNGCSIFGTIRVSKTQRTVKILLSGLMVCLIGASPSWSAEGTESAKSSPQFKFRRNAQIRLISSEAFADVAQAPASVSSAEASVTYQAIAANQITEVSAQRPATYAGEAPVIRPPKPANKMTVRISPAKDRLLSSDATTTKSIGDVQSELNTEFPDPTNVVDSSNLAGAGWTEDNPYGKYIYIHHEPLLFEDIPAERYGESCGPFAQPIVSFGKFVTTAAILPYKATADYVAANHEGGIYSLDHQGNVRPGILDGSFLPPSGLFQQYPAAVGAGAAAQAGTIAAGVFIFPVW